MLVEKMTSADHALCANSLQLINSLMRDAIASEADTEWPKFIKRLQELGVIKSVYGLMQSTAVQDLAQPLLEFQALTKVLLKRWREERVDMEKSDHRRALRGLHMAGNPEKLGTADGIKGTGSKKHHPEKWRRLGFETESPAWEFDASGFLGLMDLTDFVYKNEDGFQKLLLEQAAEASETRCPIARASLSVTVILYEHFEVEKADVNDDGRYTMLETRANFDRLFRPLLLHWSRLHTGGLNAFIRLWKATGAEVDDFEKIEELVRILIEQVVGQAPRIKEIKDVEDELADFEYQKLRDLQMELLELTYEDAWGHHLRYGYMLLIYD
jgi:engulfment and cell motility protein 1